MSKLPAILFYTGDWLKDVNVQSLDYFDQGVWLKLICYMHQSEIYGKLSINHTPMSEKIISKVLGLSLEIASNTIQNLLENGVMSQDSEGFFICRRMVKAKQLSEVRAEVGALGGRAKAKAKQKASKRPSKVASKVASKKLATLEYENEIEDLSINNKEIVKAECAPLWRDCEFLRMTTEEARKVLASYEKNKYPIELLPFAVQELENWLAGTGKEAMKARSQKTHYRRLTASWVLQRASSLLKLSGPPQPNGKLTNAQKAKQISNKIRSMNENGRSANSGFDGVSNSLLAANGSDRGALSSISGELPRERSANDEKSNSVVRKELATQLSAFDSRNSSSPESSPQVDAAEIIQSLTRKFDTNGTGKTEADRKLETEIPRTLEIITKEIGK